MVLSYYGINDISEEAIGIIAKTVPHYSGGTTNENLLLAAKHYGLTGEWQTEKSLDDLRAYVEKNIPVIVEWFSVNEVHYAIVVGADEDQIILLDPENGEQESFSHEQFMSIWFSFSGPYITSTDGIRLRWMLPLTKAA